MTQEFHALAVAGTELETATARTVGFDVPESLVDEYRWRAGQHVTVRFEIGGNEVRRSYSISAPPDAGSLLQITVKRIEGGLVSAHINDRIEEGDRIGVTRPFGGFCLEPGAGLRRTHYFFGAGSGITPLFAMIKTVLQKEPYSFAHLVYGNRSAKSIIFRDELADMCGRDRGRFTVSHVLSAPSLFSRFSYWRRGRIDAPAIETLFLEQPPRAQDTQYYVCGPGGMNAAVKAALLDLDVPKDRIHMESYGRNVDRDDSVEGVAATANVELKGARHEIRVDRGETILEACRKAGLAPPYSCESGVCGACKASLKGGKVHMRARAALEDSDIRDGAILTCQALPQASELTVDYTA